MDQAHRLAVFQAQTVNVRDLTKFRKRLNRGINGSLRCGDADAVELQTKLLGLLFCAWAEANFSKLIHTPYGLTLDEIAAVKLAASRNIEAGWRKCLEIGLGRVKNPAPPADARRSLLRLVQKYVVEPSQLRNKIAHGQWTVALDGKNTALQPLTTSALGSLNSSQIYVWFESLRLLADVVEALIESPDNAFHRDYAQKLAELQLFETRTASYSSSGKIASLKSVPQ